MLLGTATKKGPSSVETLPQIIKELEFYKTSDLKQRSDPIRKLRAWRNVTLKKILMGTSNPFENSIHIDHTLFRTSFESPFIYSHLFLGNVTLLLTDNMEYWYGYECGANPIAMYKHRSLQKLNHSLNFSVPFGELLKNSPVVIAAVEKEFKGKLRKCNDCNNCLIKVLPLEENVLDEKFCRKNCTTRPDVSTPVVNLNKISSKKMAIAIKFKKNLAVVKTKCSQLSISE